jgi:sialidase-1
MTRLSLFAAAGLLALLPGRRLLADPLLPAQDLFVAGGRYKTCRIPGIIATPRGALIAYCEARYSSGGDWESEDLLFRRSEDGGRTWTPARKLVDLPGPQPINPLRYDLRGEMGEGQIHAKTFQNLVMIPDRNTGAIHVIFELDYWRCFYLRSDDDGRTFSTPREISSVIAGYREKGLAWRAFGNGCGHGIQLRNGRLLVALWLTDSSMRHGGGHRPDDVGSLYSDDHGRTWQIGDWAERDRWTHDEPSETCEVELSDGRVLFNSRAESPRYLRAFAVSPDGSSNWSPSGLDTRLYDPWCEASILRLPGDGPVRILFCNPDSRDEPANTPGGIGRKSRPRMNLSVKLSPDDCRSWPVSREIDSGVAGYSDLAALPDGSIFCLYERGTTNGRQTANAAITLVRFDLSWLTGGRSGG